MGSGSGDVGEFGLSSVPLRWGVAGSAGIRVRHVGPRACGMLRCSICLCMRVIALVLATFAMPRFVSQVRNLGFNRKPPTQEGDVNMSRMQPGSGVKPPKSIGYTILNF